MVNGDTIFAYCSGESVSGVAVLRVSGPECRIVSERMIGKPLRPRHAHFQRFVSPVDGEVIDEGIVIFFPGPESFSGEDCLEFQGHGGAAVRAAMYLALSGIDGCRLAEPGEFTKRALLNGKLDLVGVEGLSDLLGAETEQQRKQAVSVMAGALSGRADAWRGEILACLALVEAFIDFSDEGDAPVEFLNEVQKRCGAISRQMLDALEGVRSAEIVRKGFRVGICGRPNAGKSSLLNWFAKRDVAIVTNVAGTTRDVIEVSLDLDGWLVVVSDTAGLRDTVDVVEQIGVRRAREAVRGADLAIWLWDGVGAPDVDQDVLESGVDLVVVRSKCDVALGGSNGNSEFLAISVSNGEGLVALRELVLDRVRVSGFGSEPVLLTRARHVEQVRRCLAALSSVLSATEHTDAEIVAEELRQCAFHIGCLTGGIGVEDVLEDIFARFCMGK